MRSLIHLFILSGIMLCIRVSAQEDSTRNEERLSVNGFVRAGAYGDLHNNSPLPFISSAWTDIDLRLDARLSDGLRAYSDLRFRYGSEFHDAVNSLTVREAWTEYTAGKLTLSAGQKIIKWGRADFTNPTSKLNPQNYISRSPEREDMDMGNLIAEATWTPASWFSLQVAGVPFYRSSVLLVDPIPLPENVTITQLNTIVTGQKLWSYGIKGDFHLRGIDIGASWFQGYDPMTGIRLTNFNADFSGPVPVISSGMSMVPYRTRVAGLDFETSAGIVGIRGETALSAPVASWKNFEYVPLREIKWVLGADISLGNWRITGEYTGKTMPGFEASPVDPIIGTEPDYVKLAELLATPGFDLHEYVRQQVGAFNRLYNYQLERYYHSAGLRIEGDLAYSRLTPSVFTMYNFTTKELLVIPEIKLKPKDSLTIVLGAEIYNGPSGSLYDIVKDYMTGIYAGIKIDF